MSVPDARPLPSAPPDRFEPVSSTVGGSAPIMCTRRLSDIRLCRAAAAASTAVAAASAPPPARATAAVAAAGAGAAVAVAAAAIAAAAARTLPLDGAHTTNRLGC